MQIDKTEMKITEDKPGGSECVFMQRTQSD